MWKYFILLVFCSSFSVITSQVVSNVRLIDHKGYFVQLMQATMNKVETELAWCNLKIPELSQTISQQIYGWDIEGTVTYKNGFLRSIDSMEVRDATVQQIWAHSTVTNTSTVTVRGTLRLEEVALAFDVELALDNGDKHHSTGVFTHEIIEFAMAIQKNLHLNTLTASGSFINLSGGSRRMIYHPNNKYTEVLQRSYVASSRWDALNGWAKDIFTPVMQNLATSTIQFPDICYNCAV